MRSLLSVQSSTKAAESCGGRACTRPSTMSPETFSDPSDPCLALNGVGTYYREFSCMYPALEPFYFWYVRHCRCRPRCAVAD